jgi:hypothetical protein
MLGRVIIGLLVTAILGCAGEPLLTDSFDPDLHHADTLVLADGEGETYAGPGIQIPSSVQRPGNAEAGYQAILAGDYVGCGIPYTLWELADALGYAPTGENAPGRKEELPYFLSHAKHTAAIDLISPNCLTCHAGRINGTLIIGLGSTDLDYTQITGAIGGIDEGLVDLIESTYGLTEEESIEFTKFTTRMQTVLPYITPRTAGVNPADNLAAILFAHRDPDTLEWHDEPILEPPPQMVVPIDVPPWWWMKKKHAMLYVGAGRGDHARIMMTASTLCVDTVEAAKEIDKSMPDVRAFISSIEPPPYPFSIDTQLAENGEAVFQANCAQCHGTYGEDWTYPNILIPTAEIGTDPLLSMGASQFTGRFIDWFNASFYGETAQLVPLNGYVAPPLLDSTQRPTFWRRSFNSQDYDPNTLGWKTEVLVAGQDAETDPALRRTIYDTTLSGYKNGGHLYGDHLSKTERGALLEYLKTL